MKIKRTLSLWAATAAAALVLSGCGSPDPLEPAELQDYRELVQIKEDWTAGVGESLTGLLTPAVTERGIYAAGDRSVYLLDPATGKKLWETETESEITAGVGTDGRLVAVGTASGELEVFDETGKKLWQVKLSGEMSVPPLVGSGFVVVRTADTRVTAFDAATGERRWRYQSQVPALTVRTAAQMKFSPAGILVGQANGRLLALDAQGKMVFDAVIAQSKGITEVERLVDVVGSPFVDGRMMCAAAFQGNIVCMSSQNGRLLWSQPVDAVTGPVSDGHNVYVVTAQGDIQAFDYETGKPVWTNKDLKWRTPSAPVPMNKVILVGDYDGVIHALDQATGEIVGRTTVSGAVNVAPLALGEGRVLVQTADGEIAALTLSE